MHPTMNANTKIPKLITRPFLLLRLVAFIVLFLLNILTLSFAAFNITASRTWDKYVSVGTSLAVFNSSVFLFISTLILGESKFSHAIPPVSVVSAELCWMTFMTFLTFLSSVLSTRIGPAKMCSSIPVNVAMCASSILVLPVSWMNFFIFFSYSVTLLIVTILHAPFVPDIWYSAISEVPWFDLSTSSLSLGKPDLEHQTVYGDAFRSAHPSGAKPDGDDRQQSTKPIKPPPRAPWLNLPRASIITVASFTPTWAKHRNAGLTRGLHNPFIRSPNDGVPTVPVRPPVRAVTKPTLKGILHEMDDDPFAAPTKHDTASTKVPNHHHHKKQSLEPLPGFDNLLRWSTVTTSNERCNRDRNATKRNEVDTMTAQNLPDRSSSTTVTTTTVVLSPSDTRSVSSLFPHDVGEEDWNLPLKKPPFKNGQGEGWTTAGAHASPSSLRKGPKKRYI